jgi:hypothetical protein
MPTLTPHRPYVHAPVRDPGRLTRRSFWMLAVFVGAYVVAALVGGLFMSLLDLQEGDLLLMAAGFGGWAAEIVTTAILFAAPAVGVWFAVRALRRGSDGKAWVAFALNALLVLWVLYMFADAIRVSYYPG